MMPSVSDNLVVVFHSYPNKPCFDGLMAAILTTTLMKTQNVFLVPYWRTQACFERVKNAVSVAGVKSTTSIIYVDCSPDLNEEVEFLSTLLEKMKISVFDHHPLKEDSPMKTLFRNVNFTFTFDADHCATEMIYSLLDEQDKRKFGADDLIRIIQYSEYEGMDPKMAGKDVVEKIAKTAFKHVLEGHPDEELKENLKAISGQNMELFFVMDHVLADPQKWKFLYDSSITHDDVFRLFQQQSCIYISESNSVISGENRDIFSVDATNMYLNLLKNMKEKLNSGKFISDLKIGPNTCNVLVASIDIFKFGRSLEPFVRATLVNGNGQYAILMNTPTKTAKGDLMYYFSLRRFSEKYDARNLAEFVKNISGSDIGGGHPWASGVTLNQVQYEKFLRTIGL